MLVDESLDHLQVTTVTLKGERSVSSLIHCNCGYKQIMDTRKKLTVHVLVHIIVTLRKYVHYFLQEL